MNRQPSIKIDISTLKTTVNFIANTCDVSKLKFTKKSMTTRNMDLTHVSMIEVELFPEVFEKYTVDKAFDIQLDFKWLKQLLKGFTRGYFEITFDDKYCYFTSDCDIVKIRLNTSTGYHSSGISQNDLAVLRINTKEFVTAIKKIKNKSSYVKFSYNTRLELSAYNTMYKDEHSITSFVDPDLLVPNEQKNPTAHYSLEYLLTQLQVFLKFPTIAIAYKNSYPCRFTVNFSDQSALRYYLAPRQPDEDENK